MRIEMHKQIFTTLLEWYSWRHILTSKLDCNVGKRTLQDVTRTLEDVPRTCQGRYRTLQDVTGRYTDVTLTLQDVALTLQVVKTWYPSRIISRTEISARKLAHPAPNCVLELTIVILGDGFPPEGACMTRTVFKMSPPAIMFRPIVQKLIYRTLHFITRLQIQL